MATSWLRAVAASGLAAAVLILSAVPASGATVPNGFEERTVASGLTGPTALAWAPDGRLFVAEQRGRVRVVSAGGALLPAPLLDIGNHVYAVGDRGLLGIAVDSDFASNHFLYLLYVYQPSPAPQGLPRTSRLTRVTVFPDNTSSAETVILGSVAAPPCPTPSNTVDCIPSDSDSHSIGTVRSAPDGTLFLGSGDGSDWTRADPRALRTYDEQSFAGKIMHIDRAGNGLPGHPFCSADNNLTHVCTKLYAKGLRNPFRFTLRPGGDLAIGDVGWEAWEEFNLGAGGRNYGWPCYEGSAHTSGYRDMSGCAAQYANEGTPQAVSLPQFTYRHADFNYNAAIIGGPTYPGGSYPAAYNGDIFIGDYAAGFIKHLDLDVDGRVIGAEPFATGWYGVDLELGPGNDLFYTTYGDGDAGSGAVKRIVYTPTNRSPVAAPDASPAYSLGSPLTVHFSAARSSDADGDALSYDWDFGDGSGHSTQRDPVHTYTAIDDYDARLTVRDGQGGEDSATVRIAVGNTPPVAKILAPTGGSKFQIGQTINLAGQATDEQEGTLSGSALSWHVALIHNAHVHGGNDLTGTQPSFISAVDHDADAHYRITLVATDARGLASIAAVEIYPKAITLTMTSSPPGAPLTYGGTSVPAPIARTAAIGFTASISADETFVHAGRLWAFTGWSDGSPRAHSFTIPASDVNLSAVYRDAGPDPLGAGPAPLGDRSGPAVSLGRLRGLHARVAHLSGRVADPSGVKRVRVALRAARKGARCHWWNARLGRISGAKSCGSPRWISAKLHRTGTGRWTWRVSFGGPIRKGSYRLLVEAFDRLGNRSGPIRVRLHG